MPPIKTQDVVRLAWSKSFEQTLSKSFGPLTPELVKGLSPYFADVYKAHAAANPGAQLDAKGLHTLLARASASAIRKAAGEGRSAHYLSKAEAATLPPDLAPLHGRQASIDAAKRDARAALDEPFPSGTSSIGLALGRFLSHQEAKVAQAIADETGLLGALGSFHAALVGGAPKQIGEHLVWASADGAAISIDGRSYSTSSKTRLAFVRGDELTVVGWDEGHGVGSIRRLDMVRYDLKEPHGDPVGATRYARPTTPVDLDDLWGDAPIVKKPKKPGPEVAKEQLLEAWPSVDAGTLASIARAITGVEALGLDEPIDALINQSAETIGALAWRADFAGKYRALVEAVEQHGRLELGDCDTYVYIADEFKKSRWDDDDKEIEVTLVRDRGPLLVVENIFGGLGHACVLDALAQGELEIYVTQASHPRGKLHVDADGQTLEAPSHTMARRVADDLLEHLPAALSHEEEE